MKENTWKSVSIKPRSVPIFNKNAFGVTFPFPMPSEIAIQDLSTVRCLTKAVSKNHFYCKIYNHNRCDIFLSTFGMQCSLILRSSRSRQVETFSSDEKYSLSASPSTLSWLFLSFWSEGGWKLWIHGVFKFCHAISVGCTNALILVAELHFSRMSL